MRLPESGGTLVTGSQALALRLQVACQASKAAAAAVDGSKEAHKIFDEAFITVKSGDGGAGEIVEAGRGKYVKNNKYHPGSNQPKQIWLPASDPADGADGADVYVVCDPSLDSLLHLHKRKSWLAPKGAQGNPAMGSSGPKRNSKLKKAMTPPLQIPVPPGTVVKRKSTGQLLGEVVQPGDRILVAKGGKGGMGMTAPSRGQKQRDLQREIKAAEKSGGEVVAVEDVNWKEDAKGLPGRQLGLQLLLRVVADVGIVGFPNAGKSSLLAALTRASPEVAPYPFTTLMPNLGVMGGQAAAAAGSSGQAPVLADLPGLIEGAHKGVGLGRMFLRHLRRTRLLLHVVDGAAADPGTDYLAVREELRLYNPDYVARPHIVALNKVDLEDAGDLREEVTHEVMAAARKLQQQHAQDVPGFTAPAAIIACSAVTGEGVQQLAAALQAATDHLVASEGKQQQQQQRVAADALAAAVAAAVAGAAAAAAAGDSSSDDIEEDGEWDEDEYEEWEGEEDEEWVAAAVRSEGSLISGTGSSSDDEAAPQPLAADDPDRWLFELSEDKLLAMADAADD
ncbi:hypothetical protein OEZ86_000222 [Tetradesmus obliquus]|nr:hypothetical protein OEZ86_000222 [Tetradesmus obliquus]